MHISGRLDFYITNPEKSDPVSAKASFKDLSCPERRRRPKITDPVRKNMVSFHKHSLEVHTEA